MRKAAYKRQKRQAVQQLTVHAIEVRQTYGKPYDGDLILRDPYKALPIFAAHLIMTYKGKDPEKINRRESVLNDGMASLTILEVVNELNEWYSRAT